MKKTIVPFLVMLVLCLAACSHSSSSSSDESDGSASPTSTEQAVITEMNFARTRPKEYVAQRLVPQQTNPTLSGSDSSTFQDALAEGIDQMSAMTAFGGLSFGSGLYKAAQSWVKTQGAGTSTGHDPKLYERMEKYCSFTAAAENIAYGYSTAEDIVAALLIDDKVSDRGHRTNLLNGSYTHAGASIGSHGYYEVMCCIDYAGGYSEK